jgi:hypothetical protein
VKNDQNGGPHCFRFATSQRLKLVIEGRMIFENPLTLTLSPDAGEREPECRTCAVNLTADGSHEVFGFAARLGAAHAARASRRRPKLVSHLTLQF